MSEQECIRFRCERLAKEDELCGPHLAGKRRRERANEEREARWEAQRDALAKSRQLANRLRDLLGVEAMHLSIDRHGVHLTPEVAAIVIERLGGEVP